VVDSHSVARFRRDSLSIISEYKMRATGGEAATITSSRPRVLEMIFLEIIIAPQISPPIDTVKIIYVMTN
jgi:hypothetical protein